MPGVKHTELVQLGAKWLKRNGFGVVATELDAVGSREKPDVIGFRSICSAIIEVKTSRADFRAERLKPERRGGAGLGLYRFYLCPHGMLSGEDIPQGWGLLTETGGRITDILRPAGNLWPGPASNISTWNVFQHQVDEVAERRVLYSIARRLASAGTS